MSRPAVLTSPSVLFYRLEATRSSSLADPAFFADLRFLVLSLPRTPSRSAPQSHPFSLAATSAARL